MTRKFDTICDDFPQNFLDFNEKNSSHKDIYCENTMKQPGGSISLKNPLEI